MAARLTMLLPRLVALVLVWLLAAASFTFAAGGKGDAQEPVAEKRAEEERAVLAVPDVRGQAYVFAKGMLEDSGFAWRVTGEVEGYAANTVSVQNPAPGVQVVDTGAPTVVLGLERNPAYEERGLPENASPYEGTRIVLAKGRRAPQGPAAKPKKPAAAQKPAAGPKKPAAAPAAESGFRKPDFVVPGARREPADELPLPRRARLLDRRVGAASRPTSRLVDHWLYQHTWIVTGALFGWKDGDEALRILIGVDRDLQARFGFGARSEAVARRALAEVLSQKR